MEATRKTIAPTVRRMPVQRSWKVAVLLFVFNHLVVMAPGAIVDAAATWTAIDPLHVRGLFTNGDQTDSAFLTFDADYDFVDFVDFVSDDRTRASADGKTFMQLRWSTPLAGHRDTDGRRILTHGEGCGTPEDPKARSPTSSSTSTPITYNGADDERTTEAEPSAPLLASRVRRT